MGSEKSPETVLKVEVKAPWWATPGAYVAYFVVIVLLVGLGIWLYLRMAKRKLERSNREEMMMMRIQNLIDRCSQYEEEARQRVEAQPEAEEESAPVDEEPEISEQDREFIAKAISLVEANLGTKGFSVEQLSRELCMERTGLYKKMTYLLEKTPSSFIRSIRLNRAAALIKEGKYSITEIAELTGFSSASHMSRHFSEEFGCTPSAYSKLRPE